MVGIPLFNLESNALSERYIWLSDLRKIRRGLKARVTNLTFLLEEVGLPQSFIVLLLPVLEILFNPTVSLYSLVHDKYYLNNFKNVLTSLHEIAKAAKVHR